MSHRDESGNVIEKWKMLVAILEGWGSEGYRDPVIQTASQFQV